MGSLFNEQRRWHNEQRRWRYEDKMDASHPGWREMEAAAKAAARKRRWKFAAYAIGWVFALFWMADGGWAALLGFLLAVALLALWLGPKWMRRRRLRRPSEGISENDESLAH